MLDEAAGIIMRIRSLLIVTIMTLSSLSSAIATDTVTTQDIDLSGNHTMTGNYTVSHGTTLTIKPGSVIDMQEYWMKVEGTLVVDNSTIMSSIQSTSPGGHNAGVWDSVTIVSGGNAILDNVTISNAKSCLIIDGSLIAKSLTIEDCLIGVEVAGTADISGLSIESVDNDGVRVSGGATLSQVEILSATTGISSTGSLVLDHANFEQIGTGLSLDGGTADVEDLNFVSGVGTGVSVTSNVSGGVEGMTGTSGNAIVAIDSTGFHFSNVDMSGQRLVNSWSAGDLTITGATYFANSPETPIDLRTSGTVLLNDISLTGQFSSLQGSYDAPWIAVALSGSGDYILSDSNLTATEYALKARGTGTLSVSNTTFQAENNGLSFSGISQTSLDNVTLNISQGGDSGIDILQGAHYFKHVDVNMPFNQFETGSVGVEAWWCSINSIETSVSGFANSMNIYESVATFESLNLVDSSKQGLYASSSMIHVSNSLVTRVSDNGIVLESSNVVLRSWTSSYHEDAALIDSNSEATIWQLSSTSNLNSDSTGEGTLNYGSSQSLNLNTMYNNRLWEMTVNFEDLTGNSVDANWQAMGFSGVATSGTAILPVSEAGSQIIATYGGVGAISLATGVQGGSHSIQVPIMPQGDWNLVAGSVVVLGPTEDNLPHMAGGNVTIPANAKLVLQDTELIIPGDSNLTIESYGDFEGENSRLQGNIITHSDRFSNSYSSDLTVEGDVFWTSCQNDIVHYNLNITGLITLDHSCKVTVNSGSIPSNFTIGTGASFEIVNTLEVTVLDKGEPVQGASITIQGQSVSTDSDGKANKTVTAFNADTSGSSVTGLMQVQMNIGQISDLMAWNTSASKQHTFTASTIQSGALSEWLELDRVWSPYHLTGDLVIPPSQTLTVNDGVFLRIADEVTITVEGTFMSGNSTISSMGNGARWGGLVIGNNADTTAQISGTSMVEGSPLITIDGQANVAINHAYLARSSGAEPLLRSTSNAFMAFLTVASTTFVDSASYCAEIQGGVEFSLTDVEMTNCHSDALWTQGTFAVIDGLKVSDDVTLAGVEGTLSNLEGENLEVSNLDGFVMSDLTLSSLIGNDNRYISIDGAIFDSAPAIDLDNSAGALSNINVDCGGSGTGITAHHGRSSASLTLTDSSIKSCTKGIDLHTDGGSAPFILNNVEIDSLVAIASDGSDVIVNQGSLNGSLDVDTARADLYDVAPLSKSTTSGEIQIWSSHIFDIRLGEGPQHADLLLELGEFWSGTAQGSSILVAIPVVYSNNSTEIEFSTVKVTASAENLPDTEKNLPIGLDEQYIIQVDMVGNSAPEVEIIIPDDGFRIMETLPIEIRAIVSDDLDQNSDLQITWFVNIGQTTVMELNGEWNNITDLSEGFYVLRLEVTDTQGLTSLDSISLEITLLDSDGDWSQSCNADTWFDKEENVYCGPDIYDIDDDNDGSLDIRDAWPFDPCANLDTDNDGQPDDINCPLGVTTWLTEDPDDDGDGIPDVSEGSSSSQDTESSSIWTILVVIIFILAAAFMLMRKRTEVQ